MSGYIKYFENGGKNISFMIKDDDVLDKYNEIWDKIKNKFSIKFHNTPVYDEKFDGVIKANFLGDKTSKENKHYTCRDCITIDSVLRIAKQNYLQLYLEECKCKGRKTKMMKFIEAELESESGSGLESKSVTELEAKLKFHSDSK